MHSVTSSENWTIIVHDDGTFFAHGGKGSYENMTIYNAINKGETTQRILEIAQQMNTLSKEESVFWNRAMKESKVKLLQESNITKEAIEFVVRNSLQTLTALS